MSRALLTGLVFLLACHAAPGSREPAVGAARPGASGSPPPESGATPALLPARATGAEDAALLHTLASSPWLGGEPALGALQLGSDHAPGLRAACARAELRRTDVLVLLQGREHC